MNNTNNERGHASENRYAKIAAALKKSIFPHTVEIENEGFAPEQFHATGLHRVELFAAVAMASLAHAVVTSRPASGGTLRPDWKRRIAVDAAEIARLLDEALDDLEKGDEPAKESER